MVDGWPSHCAGCGREMWELEGMVNGEPFCHPLDSMGETCYMRAKKSGWKESRVADRCRICGVEWEPRTPKITNDLLLRHGFAHVGCLAAEKEAVNPVDRCHHYICAEDLSFYAHLHRKHGCPAEGAKWPVKEQIAKESYG